MNNVYNPNAPLFNQMRMSREDFTPELQENLIKSSMGIGQVPMPSPVEQKPEPPVNQKYENIDRLLQDPRVASAIGRVLTGESMPNNVPQRTQAPLPPADVPAQPNEGTQNESNKDTNPLDSLWQEFESNNNVETQQRQAEPPQQANTQPDTRGILLAEATRAGVDVKEFDNFMKGLAPKDFVELFKGYKQTLAQQQEQHSPNLAELQGASQVRVNQNTFRTNDFEKFRL